MKPSPLQWLLCISAMVAGLWGIGMLQASSAGGVPANAPRPATRSAGVPTDPGRIIFEYWDFDDLHHEFVCHVDTAFIKQEEASFGYPVEEEANLAELDRRLKNEIEKSAGPYARYTQFKITHHKASAPRYRIVWRPKLEPFLWNADLPERLRADAPSVKARIRDKKRLDALIASVFRGYLRDHGIATKQLPDGKHEFVIDYKLAADKSRPWLADCFDRFVREAAPANDEELLALLLAAFQALPLNLADLPPVEENGRFKGGFWVPTQVLQIGKGDCDSSATALCALWQDPGLEILFYAIDIPEYLKPRFPEGVNKHALLGIDAIPGIDQEFVPVGLRQYVLVEAVRPAGFDELPIGRTVLSVLPEPDSGLCMTDDCFSEP